MKITINGEEFNIKAQLNIRELILLQSLTNYKIAIELNQQLIPHSQYADTILQEGDFLEIVHAIGGG